MENTVKTYNGEIARKKDCRFIKGEFYIKNKQCFEIDGTWYRINSGYIALDHETKKYALIKGSSMIKGIVSYSKEEDNIVLGYFTPNNFTNVRVSTQSGEYIAINKEILNDGFYFNLYNLIYIHHSINKSSTWNKINDSFNLSNNRYRDLVYNLRHVSEDKIAKLKEYSLGRLHKYSAPENITKMVKYLPSEYTYGIEFETFSGMVPEDELASGGLVPLRDGSIRGIEYATIPYSSLNIGKAVSLACNTLNQFVKMSHNESLHLHIGGMKNINEEYVGILYTLCCILENEIYSMFPKYYAETSKFKSRGKDYNKPLVRALVDKDPITTFSNISTYLSSGKKYGGFGSNHPSDPDGSHKWQVEAR